MDMPPPQPPTAIVSSVNQASIDAIERLADTQHWLFLQQEALPAVPADAREYDDFFASLSLFWEASTGQDQEQRSRRDELAHRLAQIARDDALLRHDAGEVSDETLTWLRLASRHDAALPADIHASEVLDGSSPLAGVIVVTHDSYPDEAFLFSTRSGWESFASVDELLCELERHLRQLAHGQGNTVNDEAMDSHILSTRTIDTPVFSHLGDTLINAFHQALTTRWNESSPEEAPAQGMAEALDLYSLVDPYDIGRYASDLRAGRPRRSPVTNPTGAVLRVNRARGRHATASTAQATVRIPASTLSRQAGIGLPGRHYAPYQTSVLPASDSLLSQRYQARGLSSVGIEPTDGVFLIDARRYIKQDGNLYHVRFDASMRSWRLHRPDALDAQYGGPLIERRADGRWHLRRNVGLQGGMSGRPGETPAVSSWMQIDALTHVQRRALEADLARRLGFDRARALYQRMASRPVPGAPPPVLLPAEQRAWHRAMDVARTSNQEVPASATLSRRMSTELEDLTAGDLEALQTALIKRLDFTEGSRTFHEMAYRQAGDLNPPLPHAHLAAWNEALAEVRTGAAQPILSSTRTEALTPLPRRIISPEIATLDAQQRQQLRAHLQNRLGPSTGQEVYRRHAWRVENTSEPITMSSHQQAVWDEALAIARRDSPRPAAPRRRVSTDLADLRAKDLHRLRTDLKTRLGDADGTAVYEKLAYTVADGVPEPVVDPRHYAIWDELLVDIRSRDLRSNHSKRPTLPELADLSSDDLLALKARLRQRVGRSQASQLYRDMALRNGDDAAPTGIPGEQHATWTESLASIRSERRLPPQPGASDEYMASRLWFVPETEWPEVIYRYAPKEALETVGDSTIVLAPSRLKPMGASGVALFTAGPDTAIDALGALAGRWLPMVTSDPHTSLGSLTGAWARIELRPAMRSLNQASPSQPGFELYRLGGPDSHAFLLRPTTQRALEGSAEKPVWLSGHFSIHVRTRPSSP